MSFKSIVERAINEAIAKCGWAHDDVQVFIERPRVKEHGDVATPVALSLARVLKKNPMEIANEIVGKLSFPDGEIASVDVARPGYINFLVSPQRLVANLRQVQTEADLFGSSSVGKGVKCQVEYVSANPTGPLVLVSARAAAVGSVGVNLLRRAGFDADGEYYVNDHGNQVMALGESLRFRVREQLGQLAEDEVIGAYPGEYLKEIAGLVTPEQRERWDKNDDAGEYGRFATDYLLGTIKNDLDAFGVRFDNFFRESQLHPDAVAEAVRIVEDKGFAYRDEGALYLRTTDFGDEKDRVLVKSDDNPTYFLGDIAYHLTKLRRGYRWVLDLLGPDHHGHIPRMRAAASIIGAPEDWLRTLTVGWVRLMEGSRPISMSKRAGEIITMRELLDDVGADVAKYMFLTRRANSPLDFDLELARKQSDENPVYYVQYAHARIASVIRFAESKGEANEGSKGDAAGHGPIDPDQLVEPSERELMVHLLFFPYEVEAAALSFEPHRLTVYARELAMLFHRFYHEHRIVTEDGDTSHARLFLVRATKQVLKNVLVLTGVDAPGSM